MVEGWNSRFNSYRILFYYGRLLLRCSYALSQHDGLCSTLLFASASESNRHGKQGVLKVNSRSTSGGEEEVGGDCVLCVCTCVRACACVYVANLCIQCETRGCLLLAAQHHQKLSRKIALLSYWRHYTKRDCQAACPACCTIKAHKH